MMRRRSDRSHQWLQGRRAFGWLPLVCLCLGFRVGEVRCQVTPSASPAFPSGDLRLTLFAGVAPGDRILIEAGEMGKIEGQLEGILRDTLFLATAAGRAQVPFSSVDRLWVEGRSTWKYARGGALLGGILGGVVFGAFAPLINSQDDSGTGEPFTASDEVGAILLGGLLGGLAVGGAGAIVGTAVPTWYLRYQSAAVQSPRTPSSAEGQPEACTTSGNRRDDAAERSSPAVRGCPG